MVNRGEEKVRVHMNVVPRSATLWNSLPRDIRQAESLGLFKRLIKEVRLGTAFVESSFS